MDTKIRGYMRPTFYVSDNFCRIFGEHFDRQFEVKYRTEGGRYLKYRPPRGNFSFLFLHLQNLFGNEIWWRYASGHSPSLSIVLEFSVSIWVAD